MVRPEWLNLNGEWEFAFDDSEHGLEESWQDGRTLEERLRIEAEATVSMFMRRDSHTIGASAFKRGETPEWPHHGL